MFLFDMERQPPGHFECGFVEARENPSRPSRFHLSRRVPLAALLPTKQPGKVLVRHRTRIGDAQARFTRSDGVFELKPQKLLTTGQRCRRNLPPVLLQISIGHRQPVAVQP